MEDVFQELMTLPESKVRKRSKIEIFFLEKTKEAISGSKREALEIASQFDKFRYQAREKYHKQFYIGFFSLLSELIKRRWMDYDEKDDFKLKSLDKF